MYDADGRRHREKVGREGVAIHAYLARKTEVREGRFVPPRRASLKFCELAARAIEDKKIRRARGTWRKDEQRIKIVNAAFGELPASHVTPKHIDKFLAERRTLGNSEATANRFRALVSSVFRYGVRMGLVAANPVPGVSRFKESAGRIRFLDADEELALRKQLAGAPERLAELDLSLHTGIRRGEQFSLRWADVDLDRGVLTVSGKTGRRHVRLNASARAALKTLWSLSNGSEFVCPGAKRAGQQDWRRWFEEAVRAAKIDDFTWHDLRHTFASRLVMEGVDLSTVKKLLGHRSIVMTERYAHLAPGHEQAAVDRLSSGRGTQMALTGLG